VKDLFHFSKIAYVQHKTTFSSARHILHTAHTPHRHRPTQTQTGNSISKRLPQGAVLIEPNRALRCLRRASIAMQRVQSYVSERHHEQTLAIELLNLAPRTPLIPRLLPLSQPPQLVQQLLTTS
jgi:hypothetical protein